MHTDLSYSKLLLWALVSAAVWPAASGSAQCADTLYYADTDTDGYGDPTVSMCAAAPPGGYVTDSSDCDDAVSSVNPGATEVCDPADRDEDCDLLADDSDPSATNQSTFYVDADDDGHGTSVTLQRCDNGLNVAATAGDCDDGVAAIHPGATEVVADAIDSNCDGQELCYADADGDGYRPGATTVASIDDDCSDVGETTAAAPDTDCDDAVSSVHPGATEVCDALDIDEDCDGDADDADSGVTGQSTFYVDDDGDGFGSAAVMRCEPEPDQVGNDDDCDDDDDDINPDAAESCNDEDDDCDGDTDEVSGGCEEPDFDAGPDQPYEQDAGFEPPTATPDAGISGADAGGGGGRGGSSGEPERDAGGPPTGVDAGADAGLDIRRSHPDDGCSCRTVGGPRARNAGAASSLALLMAALAWRGKRRKK